MERQRRIVTNDSKLVEELFEDAFAEGFGSNRDEAPRNERKQKKKRRVKVAPGQIWNEYFNGLMFNDSQELSERVEKAENFFIGEQWKGVNAPDMDKPVFNIMKRVVNYFVAMLVSDDVGVSLGLFNRKEDAIARVSLKAFEEQIKQVMEFCKFGKKMRTVLRNAAVDADGCLHVFFDPDFDTGHELENGAINCEVVDNQNVFFGNPQVYEVQDQPYIILAQRMMLDDVKEMLEDLGRADVAETLKSDLAHDIDHENEQYFDNKITVLTKYWKENGTVWFTKTTRDIVLQEPEDTELKHYPICWMSWECKKNSYHGVSVIDGLIPNQIAINKMAALAQQFIKQQAFPRVFYNEHKLKRWIGGIKPMAVQGDPRDVIYQDNHNINMSSQVGEYFSRFISNTKDLMGASDAALGNVNPENTSAIIAVQQATAVPLELVKQEYFTFVEDFVRIVLDQMRVFYGRRKVLSQAEDEEWYEIDLDFGVLNNYVLQFKVDVGSAAYWSEMANNTTLANLYQNGLIDPLTYLESVPPSALPQKQRIVEEAKRRREQQQAASEEGAQPTSPATTPNMMGGM